MWRNYRKEQTRPDGEWVRTTGMISVLGLEDRLDAFKAFADAAEKAARKGLRFGVDIELDPSHPKSPHALKVIGVAQSKSLIWGVRAHQWELGHIWHEIAEEIYEDLVENGINVASELYSIHYDMTDPEVKLYLLAPKGHSTKTRRDRRPTKRSRD